MCWIFNRHIYIKIRKSQSTILRQFSSIFLPFFPACLTFIPAYNLFREQASRSRDWIAEREKLQQENKTFTSAALPARPAISSYSPNSRTRREATTLTGATSYQTCAMLEKLLVFWRRWGHLCELDGSLTRGERSSRRVKNLRGIYMVQHLIGGNKSLSVYEGKSYHIEICLWTNYELKWHYFFYHIIFDLYITVRKLILLIKLILYKLQ